MSTKIVDNRDLALKIGYAATEWNYPITYEEHVDGAKDWNVNVIERDGRPIGAMFEKDGEVHCSILPEWRRKWLTKGLLRQIVDRPRFSYAGGRWPRLYVWYPGATWYGEPP